jgi:NAD(P)H dehydrogenase (quinone)
MKILILGATGNLGRLTAAAMSAGHPSVDLRLTSHREAGKASLRDAFPQAEVVDADWYDPLSLRDAVSGVDRILMVTPDFTTDEAVVTPNVIGAIKATGGIQQLLRFIAIPPGLSINDLTPAQLATRCGATLHLVAKPLLDASGLPVTYVNAACWIMFNLPWFMAEDVRLSRRLLMPAVADSPRRWIAETDIADLFTKILTDDAAAHIGREYLVTGQQRYSFAQVAELLSDVLGESVAYEDDDRPLRCAMGESFDVLMTYFTHETKAYDAVPATRTVETLLGRPQLNLREYIERNKALFQ